MLFINGLIAMLVYPLLNTIVTSWAATTAEGSDPLVANTTGAEGGSEGSVVPFFVWREISAAFLVGTMLSVAYPLWLYRRRETHRDDRERQGQHEEVVGDEQARTHP